MKTRKWTACILVTTWPVQATKTMDELIVTTPRIRTPIDFMASSAHVITAEDLENTKARYVFDALVRVPGITGARTGGPGQVTSIYLRGAKPQHTLILIDGVRMNGQLDPNGYDLTNLDVSEIERIEILKGPQSALYGSDAMAGVINIITRKGDGKPKGYFDVEGGSYGTFRASGSASGGTDVFNYNTSVTRFEQEGFSALKNNSENDGLLNTTVAARFGGRLSEQSEWKVNVRYVEAKGEYDVGIYDKQQLVSRVEGTARFMDDKIESLLGLSHLILDRQQAGTDFQSDSTSVDWNNVLFIGEVQTLMLGVDAYKDQFSSDGFGAFSGDLHNVGYFGIYQAQPRPSWFVNLSTREDRHSIFKEARTYQASSLYRLGSAKTALRAAYGTGFKAPSSDQLFNSQYGAQDLNPEKSEGWEIGLEQPFSANHSLIGASFFKKDYENFIGYISDSYMNIDTAETKGFEVYASTHPLDTLLLNAGYSYLDNDSRDKSFLLRRPWHKVDFDLNYKATDTLNLNLYVGFIDKRLDSGKVLDPYTLMNLAVRYQAAKKVELYGRIENLLDIDYETAYDGFNASGYNTPGISAYAGIKVDL